MSKKINKKIKSDNELQNDDQIIVIYEEMMKKFAFQK